MNQLRYTLLSDGASNKALMPILTWLLQQHLHGIAIHAEWADLRRLPKPPSRRRMSERIRWSLDLFPCDLLFVHRDAENVSRERRFGEINRGIQEARASIDVPPTVCVVPVRMMEAWLLFDIVAIRRAAGNPTETERLNLPSLRNLENVRDPKAKLHLILRKASGGRGRRLRNFNTNSAVQRIPEYIEDFSPLRILSAFQTLESHIRETVMSLGFT